jgi:hypothetical protein
MVLGRRKDTAESDLGVIGLLGRGRRIGEVLNGMRVKMFRGLSGLIDELDLLSLRSLLIRRWVDEAVRIGASEAWRPVCRCPSEVNCLILRSSLVVPTHSIVRLHPIEDVRLSLIPERVLSHPVVLQRPLVLSVAPFPFMPLIVDLSPFPVLPVVWLLAPVRVISGMVDEGGRTEADAPGRAFLNERRWRWKRTRLVLGGGDVDELETRVCADGFLLLRSGCKLEGRKELVRASACPYPVVVSVEMEGGELTSTFLNLFNLASLSNGVSMFSAGM